MHEAARIILYALVAAASPGALLATLAVLASKRGRVNGIVFMAGFVVAQAIALLVVYVVGMTTTTTEHRTINAYVELAAGVGLIVFTLTRPRRDQPRVSRSSPRTAALMDRLSRVTPGVSLGIGALLGVGAKRLVITIIAAGTLALSAQSGAYTVWLGLLYVVLATVIVWFPVVYVAILGRRAESLVARVRSRTDSRGQRISLLAGLVLGALLIADALGRLLA